MKITTFFSRSISAKLILLFLLASVLPLIIVSYISFSNSKKELMDSINSSLLSITSSRENHVEDFLSINLDFIKTVSSFDIIQENLSNYNRGVAKGESKEKLETVLEKFNENSNVFYRSKILDTRGVVVATNKTVIDDTDEDKSHSEYFIKGLEGVFVSDPYLSPELNVINIAYSCPIYAPESNIVIGVLVIHQGLKGDLNSGMNSKNGSGIENILINPAGMGRSGETFIVDGNGLCISHTRLSDDVFLNYKMDKTLVESLVHSENAILFTSYSGKQVLGNAISIKGTDWTLVGQVETEEAFAPVKVLQNQIILAGLFIVVIIVLLAYLFSRYLTLPILKLTGIAKSMALGELNIPIEIRSQDEIGQLGDSFKRMQQSMVEKERIAREISEGNLTLEISLLSEKDSMGLSFKNMVSNLRYQINEMSESVNVLSASTSEIMASVSQLASSSAETATSVSETTTTVEEVKQTAEVSNLKARRNSENAENSKIYSAQGENAVKNTIEGMSQIKTQMESIVGNILRLNEQSQAISDITLSVNELAEQSNILAVNAAIEAAKAGEQGKGFGVVAQEMRTLSERSKESNLQIRNIIKEIQKSISTTVMATEEGNKAVAEGLKLSSVSSHSIKELTDSVEQLANASLQIAASSQQQLEGMDQIAIAMGSIKEASIQASTSTQQSAEAVKDIQMMAENLSNLIKRYKI